MSQIKATILADSLSPAGIRITSFELEYPRFIHSELMTHRLFSRNAMSSRAVPIEKMIEQVSKEPAIPVHWGQNQPGMQAKAELGGEYKEDAITNWMLASASARMWAEALVRNGCHKQIANRILEPFQLMKTVLTATEFNNFFWLRNHEDAQPEIKKLAELMFDAMQKSLPTQLQAGEWHLPYVEIIKISGGMITEGCYRVEYRSKGERISFDEALAVSASCCAQVSYRVLDDSLEKAEKVYQRLVASTPVHASPFEHQATPMKEPKQTDLYLWEDGATHLDKYGNLWSGNFKGWIQHRQLITNNVKEG